MAELMDVEQFMEAGKLMNMMKFDNPRKLDRIWTWGNWTILRNMVFIENGKVLQSEQKNQGMDLMKLETLGKKASGWTWEVGQWMNLGSWIMKVVQRMNLEEVAKWGNLGKLNHGCIVLKTLKWFFVILPFN